MNNWILISLNGSCRAEIPDSEVVLMVVRILCWVILTATVVVLIIMVMNALTQEREVGRKMIKGACRLAFTVLPLLGFTNLFTAYVVGSGEGTATIEHPGTDTIQVNEDVNHISDTVAPEYDSIPDMNGDFVESKLK